MSAFKLNVVAMFVWIGWNLNELNIRHKANEIVAIYFWGKTKLECMKNVKCEIRKIASAISFIIYIHQFFHPFVSIVCDGGTQL